MSNSTSFSHVRINEADDALRLILEGKWEYLLRMVKRSKQKESLLTSSSRCNSHCVSRHSLLHFACRFNPPLKTVKHLIKMNPDVQYQRDCVNRYPLHVAVEFGSSTCVVEFLLKENALGGITEQDANGKNLLHLVFHHYKWRRSNNVKYGRDIRISMLSIVRLLCRAAPMAAIAKDSNGKTPLMYAIEEEADVEIQEEIRSAELNAEYIIALKKLEWDNAVESSRKVFSEMKIATSSSHHAKSSARVQPQTGLTLKGSKSSVETKVYLGGPQSKNNAVWAEDGVTKRKLSSSFLLNDIVGKPKQIPPLFENDKKDLNYIKKASSEALEEH